MTKFLVIACMMVGLGTMMVVLATMMVGLRTASGPLMGVTGRGSSQVEHIDGRVDGDEGSVVRPGDPSRQSLPPTIGGQNISRPL